MTGMADVAGTVVEKAGDGGCLVEEAKLPAQALYRACGYREVGPGVIGPFPVVFFEKDL